MAEANGNQWQNTAKLRCESSRHLNASHTLSPADAAELAACIRGWARELGFQGVGFADIALSDAEQHLQQWLKHGYHGAMEYMARHGSLRSRPDELVPGTLSVISVRMDYLPQPMARAEEVLADSERGYVSRYALGRDYHKLMRKRLQQLAERIESRVGAFAYRAFVDSAPVLEKPLAGKAGLGWQGKHTNLIDSSSGSFFFLGEIYTDLPLPSDAPVADHCGTCQACIDVCPTQAIVAPYQLDARLCISYLTIEHPGSIPEALRPAIGNRIYGCDDCQLVCPWNRFARLSAERGFAPRDDLEAPQLVELFRWSEAEFLKRTEGSPLRRLGYQRWMRNIAVALGNAPPSAIAHDALTDATESRSPLIREHARWGLQRQREKGGNETPT